MATADKAVPIIVGKVVGSGDAHPVIRRLPEDETETFKTGTPVLVVSGMIAASPTIDDATDQVAGIAMEAGHNLTTQDTPQELSYGSVQNQPSAKLIPVGAPLSDGKMGVLIANDTTQFKGKLGNSAAGSEAVAAADLGVLYGLFKDPTNSYWYVDKNVTTVALGACVIITELLDPVGTANGYVLFRFADVRQQFGS